MRFFDEEKKRHSDSDDSLFNMDERKRSLSDLSSDSDSDDSITKWHKEVRVDPKGYEADTEDFHNEAKVNPFFRT